MNAPTCTKPGYTQRCAPTKPAGTTLIRLRANHSIGWLVASALTFVGFTRQSIARHQRQARGLRRIAAGSHQRDCRERGDGRLADREHMRVRADLVDEVDHVRDVFVEAEPSGRQRDIARVVPIGDVHVVVGEHRVHGAAQQRREMPGHGSDDQHARLARHRPRLAEMQQRAERCARGGFSTIGTASPSTTIDAMPNGGRRCENAQHSSSSHSASSMRPVGVAVAGGHSDIVARAAAAHARAGRVHSADH